MNEWLAPRTGKPLKEWRARTHGLAKERPVAMKPVEHTSRVGSEDQGCSVTGQLQLHKATPTLQVPRLSASGKTSYQHRHFYPHLAPATNTDVTARTPVATSANMQLRSKHRRSFNHKNQLQPTLNFPDSCFLSSTTVELTSILSCLYGRWILPPLSCTCA